jgi:cytochrome c553
MKVNKKIKSRAFALSATLVLVSVLALGLDGRIAQFIGQPTQAVSAVGHGDVATLKTALDAWRLNYEAKGGSPETFKLSLGYSKVLSKSFTTGRGLMELNLKTGNLNLKTSGLDNGDYSLWVVDNGAGAAMPKADDKMMQLGSFRVADGKGEFATQLQRQQLAGFTLDAVVVSPRNASPAQALSIIGSPDLMHKLYYADKPWLTTAMGDFSNLAPQTPSSFEFLLPKAAQADTLSDLTPVLGAQIALGRQIFHNETFQGNGRTCGTCHRADNNFTLDPNYILTLPPTDSLFVAETNPALADLEDSTLLRKHALILTNVDGPDVDIFRSVPHTLSLATTARSETLVAGGDFPADQAFANATGWSGDGAPGSGSLREFTKGAVAQHLTKNTQRIPDTDFRVPTNAELDAVEAYMLSLGRSKDYPVYKLTFNDPLTQAGKVLIDTKQNPCSNGAAQVTHQTRVADLNANPPVLAEYSPATCASGSVVQGTTANCNGCHQNAGGRSSTTNANPTRNTGVEQLKIHPARLLKPDLAYDGGFGTTPAVCGPNGEPCYGDGRFNTPPLIEAADTAPFFHNNAVSTLEEAIAAYNSDAFNGSPGSLTSKNADRKVKLDSTQIVAVASFLRAINALENIRLSDRLDNQAKQIANNASARELAKLAIEENQDAIQVLKGGVLGNQWDAVKKLEQAGYYQNLAQLSPSQTLRNVLLNNAISQKQAARNLIASCNQNAAVPATVVVPPAGNQYDCSEIGY